MQDRLFPTEKQRAAKASLLGAILGALLAVLASRPRLP